MENSESYPHIDNHFLKSNIKIVRKHKSNCCWWLTPQAKPANSLNLMAYCALMKAEDMEITNNIAVVKKIYTNNEGTEIPYERLQIAGLLNGEHTELDIKLKKNEMAMAKALLSNNDGIVYEFTNTIEESLDGILKRTKTLVIKGMLDDEETTLDVELNKNDYSLAKALLRSSKQSQESQESHPFNRIEYPERIDLDE